jgi:hypothetical protein
LAWLRIRAPGGRKRCQAVKPHDHRCRGADKIASAVLALGLTGRPSASGSAAREGSTQTRAEPGGQCRPLHRPACALPRESRLIDFEPWSNRSRSVRAGPGFSMRRAPSTAATQSLVRLSCSGSLPRQRGGRYQLTSTGQINGDQSARSGDTTARGRWLTTQTKTGPGPPARGACWPSTDELPEGQRSPWR